MNFYSDMIMNDIIDNEPLDKITDLIQNFGEHCFNAIARYSYNSIITNTFIMSWVTQKILSHSTV